MNAELPADAWLSFNKLTFADALARSGDGAKNDMPAKLQGCGSSVGFGRNVGNGAILSSESCMWVAVWVAEENIAFSLCV